MDLIKMLVDFSYELGKIMISFFQVIISYRHVIISSHLVISSSHHDIISSYQITILTFVLDMSRTRSSSQCTTFRKVALSECLSSLCLFQFITCISPVTRLVVWALICFLMRSSVLSTVKETIELSSDDVPPSNTWTSRWSGVPSRPKWAATSPLIYVDVLQSSNNALTRTRLLPLTRFTATVRRTTSYDYLTHWPLSRKYEFWGFHRYGYCSYLVAFVPPLIYQSHVLM